MAGRHGLGRGRRRFAVPVALGVIAASCAAVGVTALVLAPSGNAYDASRNLLVNGQFTSPAVGSGSVDVPAGASTITGWTVTSGSVEVYSSAVVTPPPIGAPSAQALDLDGTAPGAISQTFPTTPGWTYTGEYWVTGLAGTTPATKTATVSVNGAATTVADDITTTPAWQFEHFSFTASGTTSTITFASTTPGADGLLVTDVAVYPPYPLQVHPLPNQVVYQQQPGGAIGYWSAYAYDPNDRENVFTACSPAEGTLLPVGTTTVTCGFTSPAGPTASATFTVTVLGTSSACNGIPFGNPNYNPAKPVAGANVISTPCATGYYQSSKPSKITIIPEISNKYYTLGETSVEVDGMSAGSGLYGDENALESTARSTVGSVTVTLFGNTYTAENLSSQAVSQLGHALGDGEYLADCSTATASGSSSVGSFAYNGKVYPIDAQPYTLNLGVVSISLNQQVKVGNTITERAMFIDMPGTAQDLVIGQSVAGVNCTGS